MEEILEFIFAPLISVVTDWKRPAKIVVLGSFVWLFWTLKMKPLEGMASPDNVTAIVVFLWFLLAGSSPCIEAATLGFAIVYVLFDFKIWYKLGIVAALCVLVYFLTSNAADESGDGGFFSFTFWIYSFITSLFWCFVIPGIFTQSFFTDEAVSNADVLLQIIRGYTTQPFLGLSFFLATLGAYVMLRRGAIRAEE